jgi:hypothetical protein
MWVSQGEAPQAEKEFSEAANDICEYESVEIGVDGIP